MGTKNIWIVAFFCLLTPAIFLSSSAYAINPQINIIESGNIVEHNNKYILEKQLVLEVYNPTNARIWNINLSCDNLANWKDANNNSINCPIFISELQAGEKKRFFGNKSQNILQVSESITPSQVIENEKVGINLAITIKNTLDKPINLTLKKTLPGKTINSNGNNTRNQIMWKQELNESASAIFYAYFESSYILPSYQLPDAEIEIISSLNSTSNYSATALTTAENTVEKSQENGIWKASAIFSNPSETQINLTEMQLWEGNRSAPCNSQPCSAGQYLIFTPNVVLNPGQNWNSNITNYSVDYVPVFWSLPKFSVIFDQHFFANYTGKIKEPKIQVVSQPRHYSISQPRYKSCLKNETIYYELRIDYFKNSTIDVFDMQNKPLENAKGEIVFPSGKSIIAYYHYSQPIQFFADELGNYNFSITAPSANRTCYNQVNFSAHLKKQTIIPNITLLQNDDFLLIFVKDQYGNPLPQFNLTYTFPSGKKQNIITDENGTYYLQLSESGKYTIFTSMATYSAMVDYEYQEKTFCAQSCIINSEFLPIAVLLLILCSVFLSIKQKVSWRILTAIAIIAILPVIPQLSGYCVNMLCSVLYFLISYFVLLLAYVIAIKNINPPSTLQNDEIATSKKKK